MSLTKIRSCMTCRKTEGQVVVEIKTCLDCKVMAYFNMSLRRIRSCVTCRKIEYQVEIKTCTDCNVMAYCSDQCESANQESHKCKELSCDEWRGVKYGSILEVALTTDNYHALEKIVNRPEFPMLEWEVSNQMTMKERDDYYFRIELQDLICIYIESGNIDKALDEVRDGYEQYNEDKVEMEMEVRADIVMTLSPDHPGLNEPDESIREIVRFHLSVLTLDLFMWNEMESKAFQKSIEAFLSILDEAPEGSSANKLRRTDLALNPIKELVLAPRVAYSLFEDPVELSKSTLLDRIRKKIRQMIRDELGCQGFELVVLKRLIDPAPIDVRLALKDDSPFIGNSQMFTDRDVFYQWRIIQRLPKARELVKNLISTETALKASRRSPDPWWIKLL